MPVNYVHLLQLIVPYLNRSDGIVDEFIRIEVHRIGIVVVDGVPKRLEFLFVETFVERILGCFGLITIGKHLGEHTVVKDYPHQSMDTIGYGLQRIRQGLECMRCERLAVFLRHCVIVGNVVVLEQILVNLFCLHLLQYDRLSIDHDSLAGKVLDGCPGGAFVEHGSGLRL